MEKLQAALENARRARQRSETAEVATSAAPDPARAPRPSHPRGDTGSWDALETFDVSEKWLQDHRLVSRAANPAAVPFDILRTKILLQMRQNNWKRLAITSPMPQVGKSTIACNLALGLARQDNMRSILFDFDLRDPSVSELFQCTPKHDTPALLSGEVSFGEQAMRFGNNLACSMSRTHVKDPTRLLLTNKTADILDHIEATYDPEIMIFDAPSVLVNDDVRAFLKNVDCALIVVRAENTRYRHFDTCEREVSELTNVLGTMLNAYKGVE